MANQVRRQAWQKLLQRMTLLAIVNALFIPLSLAQTRPIRLVTGTIIPGRGIENALLQEAAGLTDQAQLTVLAQFSEPLTLLQRDVLAAYDVSIQGFVPENAYVLRLSARNFSSLRNNDQLGLVWLGRWQGARSLHPRLRQQQHVGEPGAPLHLVWSVLRNVPLQAAQNFVSSLGATVVHAFPSTHALEVWLPARSLQALADNRDYTLMVAPPALPLSPTLDDARLQMKANGLAMAPYNLDGSGINVFIYDGGQVYPHNAFGGRLSILASETAPTSPHATHVAGIVGGDGGGSPPMGRDLRGIAPGVSLITAAYSQVFVTDFFYSNTGDLEADYLEAHQDHAFDLVNNSLGGNVANNGINCDLEGNYGETSALLDTIVRGDHPTIDRPTLVIWAVGNERTGGIPTGRCGAGYGTLPPPAAAKNPIHVGGIFSDGAGMALFSSWGPTDDGRLKPLVVAPGDESGLVHGETAIMSTTSTTTGYALSRGTSMAAPAVAGVVALAVEEWRNVFGFVSARPQPSLVKAWLMHTARDLGLPGPDYQYGYGAVDAQALIDMVKTNNSYLTGSFLSPGAIYQRTVQVPLGAHHFKASLAWDDVAAAPFSNGALVNDLDLRLIAPDGTIYGAFVNDPNNPADAATVGTNTLDNQEQSMVTMPMAGTWTVAVQATDLPGGQQNFALVTSSDNTPSIASDVFAVQDFESGLGSWVTDGSLVADPAGGPGQVVKLADGNSLDHGLYLELTLPADADDLLLEFDWYMTSDETNQNQGDQFSARVRTPANNTIGFLDLRTDTWQQGVWMHSQPQSLQPWAGQTIRIFFRALTDGAEPTRFYVDNVRLQRVDQPATTDMAINVAPSAVNVSEGQAVTYTLTLDNLGGGQAADAAALVDFGDNVSLQSTDCGAALINPFYWSAGDIAPGGSASCTVTAIIDDTIACDSVVSAQIGGNWLESTPVDNNFYGADVIVKRTLTSLMSDWPASLDVMSMVDYLNCNP